MENIGQRSILIGFLFASPLSTLFLVGLAGSIPVLIHLFNRKRYDIVPWAAMRFLKVAHNKTVKRLKLEEILLLILRVSILILLVVALASVMPWLENTWQKWFPGRSHSVNSNGRIHRILVIDPGLSMSSSDGDNPTLFEIAKEQGLKLVTTANPGDGWSLISLGSPAQTIISTAATDPQKVKEEIHNLKQTHGNSDIIGALSSIVEILERPLGTYQGREVYFLSDFKRSSWSIPPNATSNNGSSKDSAPPDLTSNLTSLWQRINQQSSVIMVDLGKEDRDNLAVTDISMAEGLTLTDVPTQIQATISNFSKVEKKKLGVELLIGHEIQGEFKLLSVGKKLVNINANTSMRIAFPLEKETRFKQAGNYILQVRIDHDRLPADDQRSLAIQVRESIPILLVNGKSLAEPLAQSSELLARALYPFDSKEKVPGYPARPKTVNLMQFADATLGDLSQIDCVFLCDVPKLNSSEIARLENLLKRGGSIVFGLGPNAADNLAFYNQMLYRNGDGILPGQLTALRVAPKDRSFALTADEQAFNQPPLSAFRADNDRAGLTFPRFQRYIHLDFPANSGARKIFSFYTPEQTGEAKDKPDEKLPLDKLPKGNALGNLSTGLEPAICEWKRHRGKVVLYTSSFNTEWTNWPLSPTFPEFIQELLPFLLQSANQKTFQVGEAVDQYVPMPLLGLNAELEQINEDNTFSTIESAAVTSSDDSGLVHFNPLDLSGIYRISIRGLKETPYLAFNVPERTAIGGSESNLTHLSFDELRSLSSDIDIQIVDEIGKAKSGRRSNNRNVIDAQNGNSLEMINSEPQGPGIARIFLFLLLGLLILEQIATFYWGASRSKHMGRIPHQRSPRFQILAGIFGWVIALLALLLIAVVIHGLTAEHFLAFLPDNLRLFLERQWQVPHASAGEGTRWHLDWDAYLTGIRKTDLWIVLVLLIFFTLMNSWFYRQEPLPNPSKRSWQSPRFTLAGLRMVLYIVLFMILLPEAQVQFEREGWPDIVLLFDDSQSMGINDPSPGGENQQRLARFQQQAQELCKNAINTMDSEISQLQQQIQSLSQTNSALSASDQKKLDNLKKEQQYKIDQRKWLDSPNRLNLVKGALASAKQDWLQYFLREKHSRVHLYHFSSQLTSLGEFQDSSSEETLTSKIHDLVPAGNSTRLGDAIHDLLRRFRGGSLQGIIIFTDGVTTQGESLTQAARQSARMGIPLYFVGVGNSIEPVDLSLSDLRVEDVIQVNDRLVFEADLKAMGTRLPSSVPIILYEVENGKSIERDRKQVQVDPNGKPMKVKLSYRPNKSGERTFIIKTPILPDEREIANNKLERTIQVNEERRLKILYVEGNPRYEYRYIKSLFEREKSSKKGQQLIDLHVVLQSADQQFYKEDRSALAEFPTTDQLQKYDVIIWGDVDLNQLNKRQETLQNLGDFVKQKGGGLLFIAGQHYLPESLDENLDGALLELLPIVREQERPINVGLRIVQESLRQPYRLSFSAMGRNHPIFQLVREESANQELWNRFAGMFWYAAGYRKKTAAEVLAYHPEISVDGTPIGNLSDTKSVNESEHYPLVLQQFVGAGRVIFFGFDETWRWRFRDNERYFNQFWHQTIRTLARNRIARIDIHLDRQTSYRQDEPIKVTVRMPDDAPPLKKDVPIRVLVERKPLGNNSFTGANKEKTETTEEEKNKENPSANNNETESQTMELSLREGSRGIYEGILSRTPPGEYRFLLTSPTVSGSKPAVEGRVLPPPGELDRIQINETEMQFAAKESHGKYYSITQIDNLPYEIPEGNRVPLDQPAPPILLWNHPIVFLIILLLFTCEWLSRKRWGLL